MTDLVQSQVKSVLDAYAAHDLAAAMAVWKGDEEVDAICTSLFRELLTYMMEDPRNISFCIHLMFCAKNIERIGDHATNIAETVFYMIEGQQIRQATEGRHDDVCHNPTRKLEHDPESGDRFSEEIMLKT